MNRLFSYCLLAGAFFYCPGARALEYRIVNVVDTTMLSPNGGLFTDFADLAINGRAIAFTARETAIGSGVFVANGGTLTTIVKLGEPGLGNFLGGFNDLDISGNTVAFVSHTVNQSSTGILTGNGLTAKKSSPCLGMRWYTPVSPNIPDWPGGWRFLKSGRSRSFTTYPGIRDAGTT